MVIAQVKRRPKPSRQNGPTTKRLLLQLVDDLHRGYIVSQQEVPTSKLKDTEYTY